MKKGQSYIILNDLENPTHKLVKHILNKGFSNFEIAYASRLSSNAGWQVLRGEGLPIWLGFTIEESIININRINNPVTYVT